MPRYSPEQLTDAVATSTSKRQVLLKLGIIAEGGNYATLSKHIKKLELNTSHFTGQASNRGKRRSNVPTERYFTNELPISSDKLKKRLLREGVLQPICSSCGLTVWLGQPIPLELDHHDGNNQNNKRENIRLLCPNCHAQTPTYRSRNRKLVLRAGVEPASLPF